MAAGNSRYARRFHFWRLCSVPHNVPDARRRTRRRRGFIGFLKLFAAHSRAESKRYLVSPAVELRLPLRSAVEVDALYSRFGLRSAQDGFFGFTAQSQRANSWEFPILGRFRPIRPIFIEIGYVPRTMTGTTHFDSTIIDVAGDRTRQVSDQKMAYQFTHGLIAGAGVDLPLGHLRFSPDVRYTRWFNRSFDHQGSHGFSLQSPRNRAEILLGIWWR